MVRSSAEDNERRLLEEQTARQALEAERIELRTQNERLADVLRRETDRRSQTIASPASPVASGMAPRGELAMSDGSFFVTQSEDAFESAGGSEAAAPAAVSELKVPITHCRSLLLGAAGG
jgi:hypothetical protein